ncbi:hypothetical protein EXIGLDRAFT_837946 [Exidia glandulosa HHB12029]|uniref:Uncharacterized protein n=1 Tax=Exidia glandulosa HHB12029 TaxID=1314781 RepID=A0A165GB49_EXIGL|nr:hypothetical protein EXIGLDRAFT_837946 [Exidia glandulosa HHB12029]
MLQPDSMTLEQMRMKRGILLLFHDASGRKGTYSRDLNAEDEEDHVIHGPPGRRQQELKLRHNHVPALRMLLWTPCQVKIGAVGFYDKLSGSFVTLFNAFQPRDTATGILTQAQSLKYVLQGKVGEQIVEEQQSTWQKFLQAIRPTRTFKLNRGEDEAIVVTENATLRYLEDRIGARMWLSMYIDEIVTVYGHACGLRREDMILVTSTLDAPRWAIAVSDRTMAGRLVVTRADAPQVGRPWATMRVDHSTATEPSGAVISDGSGEPSTVLIAGLRMYTPLASLATSILY